MFVRVRVEVQVCDINQPAHFLLRLCPHVCEYSFFFFFLTDVGFSLWFFRGKNRFPQNSAILFVCIQEGVVFFGLSLLFQSEFESDFTSLATVAK